MSCECLVSVYRWNRCRKVSCFIMWCHWCTHVVVKKKKKTSLCFGVNVHFYDCCQKWPCIQSQDMHSIYYSTSLYIQFVSNQIQLKVCNTIICLSFIFFSSFLSQMSHYCLCTVRPIVYVDKNTVYSIVFINIITNKNHLQKT